jgi:hypothetical protein
VGQRRQRPLGLLASNDAYAPAAAAADRTSGVTERVASSFRALAPAPMETPDFESLGLTDSAVQEACASHGVDMLAQRIRGRGPTAAHLHQIAWHGSALADIGCPAEHPSRERVLLDAALFNLAVALTDSLVDDEAHTGAQAAEVLRPERLRARLLHPADQTFAIAGGGELAAFYALWDSLLVSLGERLADDRDLLANLGEMLARMHRSEFDAGADRLPAKELPIAFIGALMDGTTALDALYRELGSLIGLSDDWNDLAADMRRMRANQLVMIHDPTSAGRLIYIARCLRRVVFSQRLADDVVQGLSGRVSQVLALAGALSPAAQAKAASYVSGMLQW